MTTPPSDIDSHPTSAAIHRYRRARAFTRYYIVGTNSLLGRLFDLYVITLIIIGIGALVLESEPAIRAEYGRLLRGVEIFVGISFATEYLLRLWVAYPKRSYVFSFWGVIDLLAIFPFLFPGFGVAYLRMFRLLRVFSILKIARYTSAAEMLWEACLASRSKIGVFLVAVGVIVIMLGFAGHAIEPQTFTTVPVGMWWAIVTISTVGYGDVVPVTIAGRLLGSMLMLTGYGMLAVPTGIVAVEYGMVRTGQTRPPCRGCAKPIRNLEARFCMQCGTSLEEPANEPEPTSV
jgi:voltage-gated potassium channel